MMKRTLRIVILLAATIGAAAQAAEPRPAPIVLRAQIDAPPETVWQALTTREGAMSFFAPDARIEPRVGGAYEIYFLPTQPAGRRGTEGVRILAMEAPHRLLLGWNAPVQFGELRDQQTTVEFELQPAPSRHTLLTATHANWGRGRRWTQVREYFAAAWPHVLGQLQYRFAQGPIDWTHRPDGVAHFRPAEAPRTSE